MLTKSITLHDRISLKDSTRRYTPEGYLVVGAHIARTGIQKYFGRELQDMGLEPDREYRIYRPASEVFAKRTLDSFARKPVTNEHPYDTGGAVDATTATKKLVGVSGDDIKKAGAKIYADMTIYEKSVITDIENGKVGLSAGYTAKIEMKPGTTPEGEKYDGIQTDIYGNHIAVCDANAARGGQECRILDTKNAQKRKKTRMSDMRNRAAYDENRIDLPDLSDLNQLGQLVMKQGEQIKAGFQALSEALQSLVKKEPDGDEVEGDEESQVDAPDSEDNTETGENTLDEDNANDDDSREENAEVPPAKEDNSSMKKSVKTTDKRHVQLKDTSALLQQMQKKIAYLEGRLEASKKTTLDSRQLSAVVGQRVKLLREAEKILPGVVLDSMDDIAIKKKVVAHVYPTITLEKRSAESISGLYDGAVQTFNEGSNSASRLAGAILDSHLNDAGSPNLQSELDLVDSGELSEAARRHFCERSRDAWKGSRRGEK